MVGDKETGRLGRWRTRSRVPVQHCRAPSGLPIRTLSSINTRGSAMWVTPLPLLHPSFHPLPPSSCFPSVRPSPLRPVRASDSWWIGGRGVERGRWWRQEREGTESASTLLKMFFQSFLGFFPKSFKLAWQEEEDKDQQTWKVCVSFRRWYVVLVSEVWEFCRCHKGW